MTTINTARKQANSYAKAKGMKEAGYTFNTICKGLYRIFKPGNTEANPADYVVDMTDGAIHCTCPSFAQDGEVCKHTLWIGLELEKQDEADMWESICADYDARQDMEEGGQEGTSPVLTVRDVLESLQMRMVADLERTEARIKDTRFPHNAGHESRQSRLQAALEVIGGYWNMELVNRLDLQPASK